MAIVEILIILALILLNGFFAASEIAIIAFRRSKTQELINKGDKRAHIVDYFQTHQETFLATIQVGITLTTTLASAFGGASLVEDLTPVLRNVQVDFISSNADIISFFSVVLGIAYFSLVIGELIPKSLALKFTERIALFVSYPIKAVSFVFSIFIKFLSFSSNLMLRLFKDKTSFVEAKLSEEEIRFLLKEGKQQGTIEKREHEFLENVFEFSDLEVGKIMVPRNNIVAIDITESPEKIVEKFLESNYSRVPMYEDQQDNIIGILYNKDLMRQLAKKGKIHIRELLLTPLFVPETQRLHDVLQKFRRSKMHMAIVLDEHGGVAGLVTLEDILEELVGEISDESDKMETQIEKQPDGSYIIDGGILITDFNRMLEATLPENAQYNSVSGFLLSIFRRFPKRGEKITYQNFSFEIKEKDRRRIKSIIVKKNHKS